MNFLGNLFGSNGHGDDNDCVCSIIWILLLLSVCGNCSFNICDIFNNDCIMIILLLLVLSKCCNKDNCGCRG